VPANPAAHCGGPTTLRTSDGSGREDLALRGANAAAADIAADYITDTTPGGG
jgi:hypothetical protein